jgi:hypothetical protein
VRGRDLFLRATWHPESDTIVFSHWHGEVCTASTPVALTDSTKLIDLLVHALSEVADRRLGTAAPPPPQGAFARLRSRLRPKPADVVNATARFGSKGPRRQETSTDSG